MKKHITYLGHKIVLSATDTFYCRAFIDNCPLCADKKPVTFKSLSRLAAFAPLGGTWRWLRRRLLKGG